MTRKILMVGFIALLCGCLPQKEYSLHLLHTNDLHSHLLPFNDYGDCPSDQTDCLGGFSRIAGFMRAEKAQYPDTLILDAGDRFTGTPFYTLTKSRYLIKTMKRMPFDAMTFGNHEFDEESDEVEKFVTALNIPVVCANLQFPSDSPLTPFVMPSFILERGGRKIGIIGVVTPELSPLGTQKAGLNVLDAKSAVQSEVRKLTQQGVDILILLSHIGLQEDIKLAQEIPQLDIIVGGHSHSFLSNDPQHPRRDAEYPIVVNNGSEKTLIVSTGMGGQYVGVLDARFDKNGRITSFEGDTIPMDTHIDEDKITAEIIAGAQNNLEQILNQPLSYNMKPLDFTPNQDYCAEQCAVGEFLTHLLLQAFPMADIAFLNSGAIRRALPAGSLTFGHLAQVYPYDSMAVMFEVSGAELRQYLQHGIGNYLLHDRTNEMLQTAGISYIFSPQEKQVSQIFVQEQPLQEDKIYRLVTSQFIADGGDGYPVRTNYDTLNISIRELLRQQLLKRQTIDFLPLGNIQTGS